MGYYTVVYRVDGGKAVEDQWWQSISPLFNPNDKSIAVTAVSVGDQLKAIDQVRIAIEDTDADTVEQVKAIRDLI